MNSLVKMNLDAIKNYLTNASRELRELSRDSRSHATIPLLGGAVSGLVATYYDNRELGIFLVYAGYIGSLASLVALNKHSLKKGVVLPIQERQLRRERLEKWLADEFEQQPIKGKPTTLGPELDEYLAEMDEQLSTYGGLVQRIREERGLRSELIDLGRREPYIRPWIIDIAAEAGIEPPK